MIVSKHRKKYDQLFSNTDCRTVCFHRVKYLMGPFNAGPNSALFLGVALIRAGVRRAGVKWAILKMQ